MKQSFFIGKRLSVNCAAAILSAMSATAGTDCSLQLWSSRYRDEAYDGEVTFAASFYIPPEWNVREPVAVFSYMSADGGRIENKTAITRGRMTTGPIDVARLALGTNDVVFSIRSGGKTLDSDVLRFVRLSEPSRRRCTFDGHGRFFVDGTMFMPIGLYCLKVQDRDMDLIAASPFNCVMPYRTPSVEELDICHEKGVKVLYDARGKLTEQFDDEAGRAWIREQIPEVMGHPSIIAWYADDESPLRRIPRLKDRRRMFNLVDPDHPVWVVQDKWRKLDRFVGTFDVFGTDPYPVSKYPIGTVTKAMRSANESTEKCFPVWQVVQGFRWNEKFRSGELMPTPLEFANMTWQAIANGAKGLVFFRYHQLEDRKEPNNRDWWRDVWPNICAAAWSVKRYEKVIMSEGEGPGVSGAPPALAVRTWKNADGSHLLCVNTTTNELRCVLSVEDFSPERTRVAFAVQADVRCSGENTLSVQLGPLGYSAVVSRP